MTLQDPSWAEGVAEHGAVAEVLRAITRAPADLDVTLQTILDHAGRLCRADKGFVYLRDGDVYRHIVDRGATPEVVAFNLANPIRPTRGTITGRTVIERRAVQHSRHIRRCRIRILGGTEVGRLSVNVVGANDAGRRRDRRRVGLQK